jgi:hypothetical protein
MFEPLGGMFWIGLLVGLFFGAIITRATLVGAVEKSQPDGSEKQSEAKP